MEWNGMGWNRMEWNGMEWLVLVLVLVLRAHEANDLRVVQSPAARPFLVPRSWSRGERPPPCLRHPDPRLARAGEARRRARSLSRRDKTTARQDLVASS